MVVKITSGRYTDTKSAEKNLTCLFNLSKIRNKCYCNIFEQFIHVAFELKRRKIDIRTVCFLYWGYLFV